MNCTIDLSGLISNMQQVANSGGLIATHTDGAGNVVDLFDNLTSLTFDGISILSFIDEQGAQTDIDLSTLGGPQLISGSLIGTDLVLEFDDLSTINISLQDIYDQIALSVQSVSGNIVDNTDPQNPVINETITTLVDNLDGTYTYTNEDSVQTVIDIKTSTVLDNLDGTFTITDDFGNSVIIDTTTGVQGITGNIVDNTDPDNPVVNETITSLQLSGSNLEYSKEDGTQDVIPLTSLTALAYEERWDVIPYTTVGAWHVVTLPATTYPNTLVTVTFTLNGTNNRDVGVREVGSTLNRVVTLDQDSPFTMETKTNALGQIEIFAAHVNVNAFVAQYN